MPSVKAWRFKAKAYVFSIEASEVCCGYKKGVCGLPEVGGPHLGGDCSCYGFPGEMSLRNVTGFLRATDGGSTWIRFMLGSIEAEAFFGVVFDAVSGISAGPSYIKIAGDSLDLRRLAPDQEILEELGLGCSHEIR